MDYVTLLGAEAVEQAGHRMASAAESFQRSVGHLEQILLAHSIAIEASVARQEKLVEEKAQGRTVVHRCSKCNGVLDGLGTCQWCKVGRKPPSPKPDD